MYDPFHLCDQKDSPDFIKAFLIRKRWYNVEPGSVSVETGYGMEDPFVSFLFYKNTQKTETSMMTVRMSQIDGAQE